MRETCGIDEQKAASIVDSKQGLTALGAELIRLSIVAVNGQAVLQPYLAFDEWNTKTRNLVIGFYEELNTIPAAELELLKVASSDLSPDELAETLGILRKEKV
jgi:hypothetical protein